MISIRMKGLLNLLVISLCFASILCKLVQEGGSKKRVKAVPEEEAFTAENMYSKDWIDPHKMVDEPTTTETPGACIQDESGYSAKLATLQDQLANCQKELQTYKPQDIIEDTQPCDLPYLKQIIHSLLKATSDVNPHTEITLLPENRDILNRFMEGKANVHDVTDILKQNIRNKTLADSLHESYWLTIKEHLTFFDIGNLIFVGIFASLILAVLVFEMRTRLSIRQQFFYLLLVAFVVSIPWEWCRLYKKAFAAKQGLIMKNIEKHCHTDHEFGFTESLLVLLKNSFTFQGDKKCKMYQEALLVDPIWEIPPSLAFTVTVTRIIVEPLELIADAFGKSFKALFQHLPIQWQPVMFLACVTVIILCLILLSGVRISTPLFQIGVGVDPAVANASLQRLEYQINELKEQNRAALQQQRQENPAALMEERLENLAALLEQRQENVAEARDVRQHNEAGVEDLREPNVIAAAAVSSTQVAIQNIACETNNQNIMLAVTNLTTTVNAINERTEGLEDMRELLQRLRPVADQARQAEAIENNWELLGENQIGAGRAGARRPVQATEHHPTET